MPNSVSILEPQIPETSPLHKQSGSLVSALAIRERYREDYWRKHDPILEDRLLWRAQTFRHTVHLLPGQTILELGCGELRLTRALRQVSRGENPITAVTFQGLACNPSEIDSRIEFLRLAELPGPLAGRRFDCIVAMDLLDRSASSELLEIVHNLLAPGGEMVFYESNPWTSCGDCWCEFLANAIRAILSADRISTSCSQRLGLSESMRCLTISFSRR
jgi:SAM-dependent methyltransferase